MQYSTPNSTYETFIKYRLPLILIVVVLAVFNLLLYAQLTSDNPRPDLTDGVSAAQPIVAEAVMLEGEEALMPSGGALADSGWRVISGDWSANSGVLRQTGLADFDQAIVYTPRTFNTFAVDATLRHYENVGGGILFNMQRTDSLAGSHLVRFEVDGSALYWGSFDEESGFVGQGFAPVDADPFQSQRLSVHSHATTYDILLNGGVVARGIPLTWQSGHVGLAVSQSDTAYERINVRPIDGIGTAPAEEESLLTQSETISGEWVQESGVIRQLQNEPTDYMTSLNVFGRTYTLESTINLALEGTPEDSGGGFIFHMRDRNARAGASMVRFYDQGKGIVWGVYDDEGVFQGAANLELDLDKEQPVKLAVRIGAGSYDILVNDEVIISELPLNSEEGWVGLVAFRGIIEFSDVQLSIGES